MTIDLNNANDQKTFDLIPADTIATLIIKVRSGNAGPDGALRRSKDGRSEGLDLELIVADGDKYAKRRLWALLTLHGETEGHAEAGRIAQATLRAILESARGIRPDDRSEAAKQGRCISSYLDLDGMQFVGRIGVEPGRNGFEAKNKLASVITPDMQEWKRPEQTSVPAPAVAPATPPASGGTAIARPAWSR
jgi:hypothetical protein